MKIDDVKISKVIVERYFEKFIHMLELDVALVGAGPSNLVCGTLLGRWGIKAAVFESKLSPGGGMWGGGMMFNEIVVQETARELLEDLGVSAALHTEGYYVADSVETTATLISGCVKAGTPIFNLIKVVDVLFQEERNEDRGKATRRVNGLVLNWSPVERLDLHVDPLTIRASYVVDGTGHPAEVCSLVSRKMDEVLDTRTGKVVGEMSMCAEQGETLTVANSSEIYPGLYVTGMAANAAKGAPRMGPIFGGMILSGEKVARALKTTLHP